MRWHVIPSADAYEINEDGQVHLRDSNREPLVGSLNPYGTVQVQVRMMSQTSHSSRAIHGLMAEVFILGRPIHPKKDIVIHKDGDPWNNRLDNLEVRTRSQHLKEGYASGRFVRTRYGV